MGLSTAVVQIPVHDDLGGGAVALVSHRIKVVAHAAAQARFNARLKSRLPCIGAAARGPQGFDAGADAAALLDGGGRHFFGAGGHCQCHLAHVTDGSTAHITDGGTGGGTDGGTRGGTDGGTGGRARHALLARRHIVQVRGFRHQVGFGQCQARVGLLCIHTAAHTGFHARLNLQRGVFVYAWLAVQTFTDQRARSVC